MTEETDPLSTCSVSKDDVVDMSNDFSSNDLQHVVKMEIVNCKPDYIVYDSNRHLEIMNMSQHTDSGSILPDGPNDSYTFTSNMNIHIKEETISQHDSDESGMSQEEEITVLNKEDTKFKPVMDNTDEIILLNEHGIPNNFNKDIKIERIDVNDTKIYVEDKIYLTKASDTKICGSNQVVKRNEKSQVQSDANIKNNVNQTPKIYSCNDCPYKSLNRGTFVIHLRIHTGEKPYSCTYCGYECAFKSNLTQHLRTHTGDKPYACTYCDYRCSQTAHLTLHLRRHNGEKPFSCELCEFKSVNKSNLLRHVRQHAGEKPFSCKFCEHRCSCKSHLTLHMRSHTGEKPFTCQFCDYKCAQRAHLVTHLRKHTGEKPFSCTLCSYQSTKKSNLTQHLRRHTGEKPYDCEFCDYKSRTSSALKKHLKTHTGGKPSNTKSMLESSGNTII